MNSSFVEPFQQNGSTTEYRLRVRYPNFWETAM